MNRNASHVGAAEAAEILGVTRATVSRWAVEGRIIPVFKGQGIRGERFFARADVERLSVGRAALGQKSRKRA